MGNTACCQKHDEVGNFDLREDPVGKLKTKGAESIEKDGTGGTHLSHKDHANREAAKNLGAITD